MSRDDPRVPSVTFLWKGAEWQEREALTVADATHRVFVGVLLVSLLMTVAVAAMPAGREHVVRRARG